MQASTPAERLQAAIDYFETEITNQTTFDHYRVLRAAAVDSTQRHWKLAFWTVLILLIARSVV